MRPYICSDDSITVVINGVPHTVASTNPNFNKIKKGVHSLSDSDLLALVTKVGAVTKALAPVKNSSVEVRDGNVYFNGEVLHNAVTTRIIRMVEEGLSVRSMTNFLANLMENPSANSVKELYSFLEKNHIPITEDGCFLAYKYVDADYKDCYTRTIDNSVGGKIKRLPRNQVNDDWRVLCSSGYHVGSYEYAFYSGKPRRMVVKVNPADVVAVSSSENKCRVCWYEVVDELKNKTDKLPDLVDTRYGVCDGDSDGFADDDEDYYDEYEDDYDDYGDENDYDDACPICNDPDCDDCDEECDAYNDLDDRNDAVYRTFLSKKAKAQKRGPNGRFV